MAELLNTWCKFFMFQLQITWSEIYSDHRALASACDYVNAGPVQTYKIVLGVYIILQDLMLYKHLKNTVSFVC